MSTIQETERMASADSTCGDRGLGQIENPMRYRSIIDAVRLIAKSRQQLYEEEDLGFSVSPARRLLSSAEHYLLKQADVVLRGGEL